MSDDEEALLVFSELKRAAPTVVAASVEGQADFQPTELEFRRLENIVHQDDLAIEQIEKLVDAVRNP